ncbi:MAG: hypothetical protein EOO67_04410 [Microbacterium sp.]|nr:MAG: hypothetical protein EOO67_04410 [Microbacterium sp.]
MTRREIRQRERLRTASVPVITSEVLAATRLDAEPGGASDDESGDASTPDDDVIQAEVVTEAVPSVSAEDDWSAPEPVASAPGAAWSAPARPVESEPAEVEPDNEGANTADADQPVAADATTDAVTDAAPAGEGREADKDERTDTSAATEAPVADRRIVAPTLGSDLLDGHAQGVEVPASFDQLLTRGATGALSMPNALILSQTPDGGSLTSPVAATGEILITGTFALPDHYGSTGTVPGRADGKEADAVLVDGELPAASSPTPIAASAAISTIKSADEIIKPPAPERGSRLMVVLAITAGVLAVALAGVLILAITTGIFS